MDQRLEDFVQLTLKAQTQEELGSALMSELRYDGYENLVVASTKAKVLREVIWSELPDGYQAAYFEHDWGSIDPVLHKAFSSRRPFAWNDATVETDLTEQQRRFIGECRDLGVHSGFTIPLHGPSHQCELISLSARDTGVRPAENTLRLYALASSAWFRLSELREKAAATARPTLSPRETECLLWVKDGKSNWEIGQILTISERTVEFHINNAMRKLGVNNRILAFVVALQNGLIAL